LGDRNVSGEEQSQAREAVVSQHLRSLRHHRDATAFIAMHGNRTQAWLKAAVAVEHADRDACRINQATQSLETALRADGMLD
jgi:hypothetical protein